MAASSGTARAAVVGGGAVGASTLYRPARAGNGRGDAPVLSGECRRVSCAAGEGVCHPCGRQRVPIRVMSHQYLLSEEIPGTGARTNTQGRKLPLLRDFELSCCLRRETPRQRWPRRVALPGPQPEVIHGERCPALVQPDAPLRDPDTERLRA